MSPDPQYLNDATGNYVEWMNCDVMKSPRTIARAVKEAMTARRVKSESTEDEFKTRQIYLLRSDGLSSLRSILGPKSHILDWDLTIYNGVLERLEDSTR